MIISIALYAFSLAFLLFILVCCSNFIFSVLSFAPWVPSRGRDLKRIFKLADLRPGQVFYDLGCGDGRTVIYAANNFKVKAIGLEISLLFYLICRLRQALNKFGNIEFKLKNLYKENLAPADVVYFFSIPHSLNEKFCSKLRRELKPGAKIISYSFKLPDWQPKAIDKPSEKDLPVYLYEA
ncbi:MAG: methyltransferase domain-containing protein [Patescibacteria group bacterium]|nr:methyltransferase domain-containing protein [Patescibacteria group bacterium]